MFGNNSGLRGNPMIANWASPRMGLLGGESQSQVPGLLGGYPQNTENLMAQYLQNLFMRRYNPPALAQYPGMVGSQLGPGGMAYQAPQVQNKPLQQNQGASWSGVGGIDPNSGINDWLRQQYAYVLSGGGGG